MCRYVEALHHVASLGWRPVISRYGYRSDGDSWRAPFSETLAYYMKEQRAPVL